MIDRRGFAVAPTLCLVALLIVGLAVALADPFRLLVYLPYVSVGALLAIRRPRIWIGWLLIALGFAFIATTGDPHVDTTALAAGTASLGDELTAWVGGWSGGAAFLAYFALMLVFPSGHLPEGRWRIPSRMLLLFGLVVVVLTAVAPTIDFQATGGNAAIELPNPFAVLPESPFWSTSSAGGALLDGSLVGLLVAGVGSIVVRYRRSTGILRLQLRWLVTAVTFVVGAIVAGLASFALFADVIGALAWVPALIAFPTVPVAVGVAVLRYHLLEIDRIVSRTVGYALVTGILAILYAATIVLLQGVLAPITQAQTIAVAASTLAVLALFQPLRRRVQRVVDRRFDRARYDLERTSVAFSERLRNEVDMASVTDDLRATVSEAVAPTLLAVWVRGHQR